MSAVCHNGFAPEINHKRIIAGALAAANRFGLKTAEAKHILREVFTAVSGWRKTGRQLRLPATALEAYASAFEHLLMDEAGRILGKQPGFKQADMKQDADLGCRGLTLFPSGGGPV